MANDNNETVTWNDLRYHREEELYGKLRQVFEDTRQQYAAFVEKTKRHEQGFLECLGNAVRINGFPGMPELIETVGKRLRQELNLDLFVHQSPVATAHCRLRDAPSSGSEGGRLVIMVSQHFLNDLTDTEQASIIGHELGHLLFKHIHIPARAILESDLPMSAVGDLKSNVMRWMICTEVSCDMLGLISSDGDPDAFSTAMLKYTTGINRHCLQQNPEQVPMVKLMLEQFDEITSAVAGSPLSTHPLTPLRVKIANTIARSDLLSHYGQNIDRASIDYFRRDFQKLLDAEVTKVYPEIVSSERQLNRLGIGVLHLCTAVAKSDGKITHDEILAVGKILGWLDAAQVIAKMTNIKNRYENDPDAVANIIAEAVRHIKSVGLLQSEIHAIIRNALTVAASDGLIEQCELETIYEFASRLDISKPEIHILMVQLGYLQKN